MVVAVQPEALETVTEYDVDVEGLTVITAVFPPVLHKYEFPPVAVNVTLCPLQIVVADALILAVGKKLTFTVAEVDAEHPAALVTVTV